MALASTAPVSTEPVTVARPELHPSWSYEQCLVALGLRRRFPALDWSIADYRVARWLLQQGWGAEPVAEFLRHGSPGFPRRHAKPDDYLRRTVQSAAASLPSRPDFSRAPRERG